MVARQRTSEHVSAATNVRVNIRIVGRLCLWVCVSSASTRTAKTFPRQRKINGGVVFYAVRVIEKESD